MFVLPDLPYLYTALEPAIDEQTMQIHHGKHHQAYIDNLNKVLPEAGDIGEILKKLNDLPEDIRIKVRNNGGGHLNHSLFWKWMTPGGNKGKGEVETKVDKNKFEEAALGRFGSGWVWLMPDLSIITTQNQDNPIMEGMAAPILGLDVWEHAYYLRYQNRRADYVKAWWGVVNWEEVERMYEQAQ
jgi:Fe-Mn family superoxide dismutase